MTSAPDVLSVATPRGQQLFGQRHRDDAEASRVVLMHDEGADLDSLRWLREALTGQGVSIDEWDLPGHGLSDGDYDADCRDAIAAISRVADPSRDAGVSYVAVGRTCSHLLATDLADAVSLTLVRPDEPPPDSYRRSRWARTPTLCLVDPSDHASDRAAEELARQVRAWYVRAFVHGDDPDRWQQHAASMTVRLVMEQHWLRLQRRRREDSSRVGVDSGSAAAGLA